MPVLKFWNPRTRKHEPVSGPLMAGTAMPSVRRVYTVGSSTWVKPTDPRFSHIEVEVQGAGGGGGGVSMTASAQASASGGGGGGGYTRKVFPAGALPSSCAVVAGAGGASGWGNAVGSTGGTSSFAGTGITTLQGLGGAGGGGCGSGGWAWVPGGAGGAASGGDIDLNGGDGGHNWTLPLSSWTSPTPGGFGGSSHLGGGIQAVANFNGNIGRSYGGGGGGVILWSAVANYAGGYGAHGVVIVTEHYVSGAPGPQGRPGPPHSVAGIELVSAGVPVLYGEYVYTALSLGAQTVVRNDGGFTIVGDAFVCPVEGWYAVGASGVWLGADDQYRVLTIEHYRGSTKTRKSIVYYNQPNSLDWGITNNGVYYCLAGDRFAFEVMHGGGASSSLQFTFTSAYCVLTGGPTGVPGPKGESGSAIQRVTSLPVSPVDGDEVAYAPEAAQPGVWHMRYRAGGPYWECLGGLPWRVEGIGGFNNQSRLATASGTAAGLSDAAGPRLTVPVAGIYDIWANVGAYAVTSGLAAMFLWVAADGAASWTVADSTGYTGVDGYHQLSARRQRTLAAGTVVEVRYATSNTAYPVSFWNRNLYVMPVRLT